MKNKFCKITILFVIIMSLFAILLSSCGDKKSETSKDSEAVTDSTESEAITDNTEDNEAKSDTCKHIETKVVLDIAATCTTDGLFHRVCTECNEIIYIQKIEAIDHNYKPTIYAKNSTCTEAGYTYKVCETCGIETKISDIAKKEHTKSAWITDTAATCTTSGLRHKLCTICNTVVEIEQINAIEHNYGSTYTKASTCTEAGYTYKVCATCGAETKINDIAKKAHTKSSWITDTAATCTTSGLRHKKCTICNAILEIEKTNATGHNYSNNVCKNCGNTEPLYELEFTLNSDKNGYTVTGIGDYKEKDIVIPSTYKGLPVTKIDEYAFAWCNDIKSISIPEGITAIGEYAFLYCGKLSSITVPKSVKEIGYSAFSGCTNLESVTLPFVGHSIDLTSASYLSEFGYVFGNVSYAGSIQTRQDSATYYLPSKLKNVTITGGQILESAFEGCASLQNVTLAEGITSIGSYAFEGCASLQNVTLAEGIKNIESYAFYQCTSLKNIIIPTSAVNIASDAFRNCYNIENATMPTWAISYVPQNSLKNVVISGGEEIPHDAFESCATLEEVIIKNGVTTIGYNAFEECVMLKSVTLPSSLKIIDEGAFDECLSLVDITLPNGLTTIAEGAFYYCGIKTIIIPSSVETIEEGVFAGCSYLESISVDSGNKKYHSAGNCIIETTSKTLIAGCKNSVIPTNSSVTSIGDYAFYACFNLISITIPKNITSIGYNAFDDCYKLIEVYNLSDINIQKGYNDNGYVGYYALNVYTTSWASSKIFTTNDGFIFYDDYESSRYLIGYKGSETELVLPKNCNGKSYQIYQFAFAANENITSVTIPDNAVTDINNEAFGCCYNLKNLTIGDGVTYINSNAFEDCYSFETLKASADIISKMPKSSLRYVFITSGDISSSTFRNCTNLTNVIIGDDVTYIGSYAFEYCSNLTSVTIGKSVTTIGYYAFRYCNNLQSVVFENTEGWYCNYSSNIIDVSDPYTAARYLTSNYYSYTWYRSETN